MGRSMFADDGDLWKREKYFSHVVEKKEEMETATQPKISATKNVSFCLDRRCSSEKVYSLCGYWKLCW